MTRTNHPRRHSGPAANGSASSAEQRQILLSKSLSRLLRHAAQQEKIPISKEGWVRMDHLLAWRGLGKLSPPKVEMDAIMLVVEVNNKKRFGVKWVGHDRNGGKRPQTKPVSKLESLNLNDAAVDHQDQQEQNQEQEPQQQLQPEPDPDPSHIDIEMSAPASVETETETALALSTFHASRDLDPTHYFIRATQGHSIQTIETDNLLTPITLSDLSTVPHTVVHGTFYGAWSSILRDGGLKRMGRNCVHFASGPTLAEVLPRSLLDAGVQMGEENEGQVGEVLGRNKVISGMRADAQILIYVNIRRALEGGMKWWSSENGVILTEGMMTTPTADLDDLDVDAGPDGVGGNGKAAAKVEVRGKGKKTEEMVSMDFWDLVVEVKHGLGVLWRHGEGVVKHPPEDLRSKGIPRGKGGRGRGGGGGREARGKPRLQVERDDMSNIAE